MTVPIKPHRPGQSAVPEVATWALLVGGFGLVGGSLRKQRRQQPAIA